MGHPAARTPRPLRTLTGPTNYVFAAAFSPDGRILAGASADKKGYLWDLGEPGDAPAAVLDGATSYAYSPAFSPDGRHARDRQRRQERPALGRPRPDRPAPLGAPLTGPTNYVYTVAFSPDGRQLAAASTGGRAWLWDVSTSSAPHDPISFDASTDPLFTVAFSPDGATLAAAARTGGCTCGRSTRSAPPTPCAPVPAPRSARTSGAATSATCPTSRPARARDPRPPRGGYFLLRRGRRPPPPRPGTASSGVAPSLGRDAAGSGTSAAAPSAVPASAVRTARTSANDVP